jgi:hypothetical protein
MISHRNVIGAIMKPGIKGIICRIGWALPAFSMRGAIAA